MLVLPLVAKKDAIFAGVRGKKAWFAIVIVFLYIGSYEIYKHRGTDSFNATQFLGRGKVK